MRCVLRPVFLLGLCASLSACGDGAKPPAAKDANPAVQAGNPSPSAQPSAASAEVDAAAKNQLKDNIKRVGLAMHNFHDEHNAFPAVDGIPGKEHPGLSWRVYLLPFLEHAELYEEFHLDEPWNSEHNKALIPKMPDVFKSLGVTEAGKTSLHVLVGEGSAFDEGHAPGLRDFTDGASMGVLAIQAAPDQAEIWTKPGGLPFDPADPLKAVKGIPGDEFLILLADGSARWVKKTIDPATFRRLVQISDGEPVGEF